MGRRRTSKPPENSPSICRRLEWLLHNQFANSITVMAKAVQVPHANLARVINHGQLPSAEMLIALARLGLVDMGWLLAGDDEPASRPIAAPCIVPVSDRLLPEPPSRCPEGIDPQGLPTASPYRIIDAYWYRVAADSPLAASQFARQGDLLMIEGGPAWTTRPEAYLGRLVVLRDPGPRHAIIARVGHPDLAEEVISGSPARELDTFGVYSAATLISGPRPAATRARAKKDNALLGPRFYTAEILGVALELRAFLTSAEAVTGRTR